MGYTNAGKSSLLNALTDAGIPANNRLFDTLDTTTRHLRLPDTQEVLLSDTVGFIRHLPTQLVEAFKATLEELKYADILLHVIDISNPDWMSQAEVVDNLIRELGAEHTPCIRVFNKCDRYLGILPRGERTVCVSARTGEGLPELMALVSEILNKGKHHAVLRIPYQRGDLIDLLQREAAVLNMEYAEDCTVVEAVVKPEIWGRVKDFAAPAGEDTP